MQSSTEPLHNDISWWSLYPTIVIFSGHEDVAIIAPIVGPGILYQPEIFTVHCAVPDGQNCMIEFLQFVTTETEKTLKKSVLYKII